MESQSYDSNIFRSCAQYDVKAIEVAFPYSHCDQIEGINCCLCKKTKTLIENLHVVVIQCHNKCALNLDIISAE